jgi:hypothetical protein
MTVSAIYFCSSSVNIATRFVASDGPASDVGGLRGAPNGTNDEPSSVTVSLSLAMLSHPAYHGQSS